MATYVGTRSSFVDIEPAVPHAPVDDWSPEHWLLDEHLPLQADHELKTAMRLRLTSVETEWVEAWNDFVLSMRDAGVERLPGFPIWVDAFVDEEDLLIEDGTPAWKANFLRKNAAFYTRHKDLLEDWMSRWNYLRDFPPSRRKFEWQAQSAASLHETVMHLRPSGLRAKRPTYVPALVAITQTSILGDRLRRLSPREVARLQGLPEWFEFGDQPDAATYKQAGNGVNVGAAYHVFREHGLRHLARITKRAPHLAAAIGESADSPDRIVELLRPGGLEGERTRHGIEPTVELAGAAV
jgi:DNA (cytosine-5)-methyltransferase 1